MLKLDALFNLLGVLVFFILTLIAQINPPANPIEPPGALVASAAWEPGAIDVDMWVQHNNDRPVGFSNKSGKVWSLLRDDLGTANDPTILNYESAFTRGLPDGEYAVNVRCYGCAGKVPVSVSVEVRLAEGTLIYRGTVTLARDKDEKTAIRFQVRGGKVVPGSESRVFKNMKGEG